MEKDMHPKSIVILDFGGQYAHLIGRRVRECGAYSEILPPETPAKNLQHAAGIILSGGPQSVYEQGSPQADPKIFELGIPVLGICYGHQWVAHTLGGTVSPGKVKEYGKATIVVQPSSSVPRFGNEPSPLAPLPKGGGGILLSDLPEHFIVWMSHGDSVTKLPAGFIRTASSDDCENAAMENPERKIFSVQFHLEVVHTEHGFDILKKFIGLCKPAPWSIESFAKHVGAQIKREVGDKKVFMLVSGGVDSTVAFTLLNEVLGKDRVQGLLVDTGLMRKNEVAMIKKAFDALKITNLKIVDASDEFFANLTNVFDPEEKRKIIGKTFIDVQKRVSEEMHLTFEKGWMLGQGTIYPDTIETGGTKHADHIKTHHNRVKAIQEMIDRGLVIEPLKELYKDEVRRLGEELGLPHELVWRHPFPGPGLGVRILCAEESSRKSTNDQLPSTKQLSTFNFQFSILPIRSVGVQGDGRTYRHALVIFDAQLKDEYWKRATEIPNAHKEFNRVLFCLSHAAPIEFVATPMTITRERADLLREADAIVDDEMRKADLYEKIWQFPVVLIPIGMAGRAEGSGQSIVLRPVDSTEAMTANATNIPHDVLERITKRILLLPGIECVFYDLTNKPPATIEWE
jgi:GMP synthase (glutamine-hydrolysing)